MSGGFPLEFAVGDGVTIYALVGERDGSGEPRSTLGSMTEGVDVPRYKGRRRKACHHEAGHVLARWFFGFEIDSAEVQTVEDVLAGRCLRTDRGRLLACEGLVSGADILPWPFGPRSAGGDTQEQAEDDRWRCYRRDVELIDTFAGFHAEAHYLRVHPNVAALAGGDDDLTRFCAVMAGWFPGVEPNDGDAGYEALEARVDAWTRALVRSRHGRTAIRAVADALFVQGRLSGRRAAELCREAYGGRECAFEAWAEHWPPTTDELRRGFVPGSAGMATRRAA